MYIFDFAFLGVLYEVSGAETKSRLVHFGPDYFGVRKNF